MRTVIRRHSLRPNLQKERRRNEGKKGSSRGCTKPQLNGGGIPHGIPHYLLELQVLSSGRSCSRWFLRYKESKGILAPEVLTWTVIYCFLIYSVMFLRSWPSLPKALSCPFPLVYLTPTGPSQGTDLWRTAQVQGTQPSSHRACLEMSLPQQSEHWYLTDGVQSGPVQKQDLSERTGTVSLQRYGWKGEQPHEGFRTISRHWKVRIHDSTMLICLSGRNGSM